MDEKTEIFQTKRDISDCIKKFIYLKVLTIAKIWVSIEKRGELMKKNMFIFIVAVVLGLASMASAYHATPTYRPTMPTYYYHSATYNHPLSYWSNSGRYYDYDYRYRYPYHVPMMTYYPTYYGGYYATPRMNNYRMPRMYGGY
jgi:hypothetical protein